MRIVVSVWISLVVAITNASAQPVQIDDMLFDADQLQQLAGPAAAPGFLTYRSEPWATGVVPIAFSPGISAAQQALFYTSCETWTLWARIICVPYTGEAVFALVETKNTGCTSYVGQGAVAASRIVNLQLPSSQYPGCWGQSVIVHELGHLFGMAHEHQRSDRDQFIDVLLHNVQPGLEFAFERFANVGDGPYDLLSVMHYGPWAFSKGAGLWTLEPKAPNQHLRAQMGFTQEPTRLDGEAMARIYGANGGLSLTLAITKATNPVTLTWARSGSLGAQTLVAGSAPGLADVLVLPLGATLSTISGVSPIGVPIYVRVQTPLATSNEVVLRTALVLAPPIVTGARVALAWDGATQVELVARVGGVVLAVVPLAGTAIQFEGVPSGTYEVCVRVGGYESNRVAVVVP